MLRIYTRCGMINTGFVCSVMYRMNYHRLAFILTLSGPQIGLPPMLPYEWRGFVSEAGTGSVTEEVNMTGIVMKRARTFPPPQLENSRLLRRQQASPVDTCSNCFLFVTLDKYEGTYRTKPVRDCAQWSRK